MVFYFYPRGHVPNTEDFLIYMGKDKVRAGQAQSRCCSRFVFPAATPLVLAPSLLSTKMKTS